MKTQTVGYGKEKKYLEAMCANNNPLKVLRCLSLYGVAWHQSKPCANVIDPCNVLAYACPLLKARVEPELIVLVAGDCGASKDYNAEVSLRLLSGI